MIENHCFRLMKKILFNDLYNAQGYIRNLKYLFHDYQSFRQKYFSNLCLEELKKKYPDASLFLTHSATGALEMTAILMDIQSGDEVIMPSFTFVSTANAFVSKGAVPVFVDINAETLNIDEKLVEQAVTAKTKAIVAMHYAGHACNMQKLRDIADRHNLFLVEDAAMGFGCKYEKKFLGSMSDFGVVSFDITKHINAIQGGLLIVNNEKFRDRANNIYHIGTNRSEFERGEVPYYEWVDCGSKFQMNELNAAVLHEQLMQSDKIFKHRKNLSVLYYKELKPLEQKGLLRLMPEYLVAENVHEFYVMLNSTEERDRLSLFLEENSVEALFHYIPLHLSPMGQKVGRFVGGKNTEQISACLLRLPFHGGLDKNDVVRVCKLVKAFLKE
jgi:dTDP-4-amino-4,6-dideoxygalactose transaminase